MTIPHAGRTRPAAAAVEFALILPLLALVMSAGLDFARVLRAAQVLDTAASSAALYASGTAWTSASTTTPTDAGRAAAVAEGAELAPPLQPDQVAIASDGTAVTVTVSTDFPLLTGALISSRTVHLQRTCVLPLAPRPGD